MLSMLTLYDKIVVYPIREIQQLNENLLGELGIYYSSTNKRSKSWAKSFEKTKQQFLPKKRQKLFVQIKRHF